MYFVKMVENWADYSKIVESWHMVYAEIRTEYLSKPASLFRTFCSVSYLHSHLHVPPSNCVASIDYVSSLCRNELRYVLNWSRSSSVGIARRLLAGRPALHSRQESTCLHHRSQTSCCILPASHPVCTAELKRPKPNADDLSLSSAEIKNGYFYSPIPSYGEVLN
jgi:hypothetical protein